MEKSFCGSCGAPVSGGIYVCDFCGEQVAEMSPEVESPVDAPRLDNAWVQGVTADGRPNGSYEAIVLDPISLQDATRILEQMKLPTEPIDPNDICPPQLGFGEGVRTLYWEDGKYCLTDSISDPEIHMLVTDPSSILAEIYRTENSQLDVARLELSYPGISTTIQTPIPSGTPWSRLFRWIIGVSLITAITVFIVSEAARRAEQTMQADEAEVMETMRAEAAQRAEQFMEAEEATYIEAMRGELEAQRGISPELDKQLDRELEILEKESLRIPAEVSDLLFEGF